MHVAPSWKVDVIAYLYVALVLIEPTVIARNVWIQKHRSVGIRMRGFAGCGVIFPLRFQSQDDSKRRIQIRPDS